MDRRMRGMTSEALALGDRRMHDILSEFLLFLLMAHITQLLGSNPQEAGVLRRMRFMTTQAEALLIGVMLKFGAEFGQALVVAVEAVSVVGAEQQVLLV
ncbi:MAG: hypothetical protein Kow0099_19070 [Candidatus Abyssubacteria bacterium]